MYCNTPQHICLSLERTGLLIVCKGPKSINLKTNQCVSQLGSKDTRSQGSTEIQLLGVKPVLLAPACCSLPCPLRTTAKHCRSGAQLWAGVCPGWGRGCHVHTSSTFSASGRMGKQQSWKRQLGVRGSKRDYSLSVNPFPFKLSWNGTSAAGHKLLECVCISGKTCLCSSKGLPLLFASAQPVCDSFQGHPSTISFTVFSL